MIEDAQHEVGWLQHVHGIRALLIAPLLLDSEPLGALVLGADRVGAFGVQHQQLALAVASQIAVALSKAQLYRYVAEQSERLGHTLQLREEEIRKNQAILSSIGEGVIVCDRHDRIRVINPAAAELLGVSARDFLGRQKSDLPGSSASSPETRLPRFAQFTVDARTLRAHYTPVLSTNDEQLGSVVVYHDVTDDVAADQLKSTFLATASHELRTPLTSVRGYVDLLLLGTMGPLTPQQHDFLKVVKTNISHIVDLIDDILDVSKVEAGEVRLRRAPTNMSSLIHEVAESLYSHVAEKAITLTMNIAPDLPDVVVDRQRIRQVVVNLLGNACKYTPNNGAVWIYAQTMGDDVRIDIRDTGIGIAYEAQKHIFTPFYRAENALGETSIGTGLGLSITKTLLELHGGRIWFESIENQGTTFSFTLPLYGYEWTEPEWLEAEVQ